MIDRYPSPVSLTFRVSMVFVSFILALETLFIDHYSDPYLCKMSFCVMLCEKEVTW